MNRLDNKREKKKERNNEEARACLGGQSDRRQLKMDEGRRRVALLVCLPLCLLACALLATSYLPLCSWALEDSSSAQHEHSSPASFEQLPSGGGGGGGGADQYDLFQQQQQQQQVIVPAVGRGHWPASFAELELHQEGSRKLAIGAHRAEATTSGRQIESANNGAGDVEQAAAAAAAMMNNNQNSNAQSEGAYDVAVASDRARAMKNRIHRFQSAETAAAAAAARTQTMIGEHQDNQAESSVQSQQSQQQRNEFESEGVLIDENETGKQQVAAAGDYLRELHEQHRARYHHEHNRRAARERQHRRALVAEAMAAHAQAFEETAAAASDDKQRDDVANDANGGGGGGSSMSNGASQHNATKGSSSSRGSGLNEREHPNNETGSLQLQAADQQQRVNHDAANNAEQQANSAEAHQRPAANSIDARLAHFIKSRLIPSEMPASEQKRTERLASEMGKLYRVFSVTQKWAKFLRPGGQIAGEQERNELRASLNAPNATNEMSMVRDTNAGQILQGSGRSFSGDDGGGQLAGDDGGELPRRRAGGSSGSAGKNALLVGRLAKKTDWNALFVKLAKVFLQYFLDLILNDMFGTTGAANRAFVSKEIDMKSTMRDFLRFASGLDRQ